MMLNLFIKILIITFILSRYSLAQDSSRVVKVSEYSDNWFIAWSVAVSGDHAYIALDEMGLAIINISDPYIPQNEGTIDLAGVASGIVVLDQYAYIADYESGMRIVDVSSAENPEEISLFDDNGYGTSLAIQNDIVCLVNTHKLDFISVADPIHPNSVSLVETNDASCAILKDTLCFITDGYSGMRIFSIANRANPWQISNCDGLGNAWSLALLRNLAIIVSADDRLTIIDISDLNTPNIVSSVEVGASALHVILSAEHAIISTIEGLKVFDIGDVTNPHEVGYYRPRRNGPFFATAVDDRGFVYVAENGALSIFDCSEALSVPSELPSPRHPRLLSLSSFPSPFNSSTLVTFSSPYFGEARASIRDVTGREIVGWVPAYAGTRSGLPGEVRFVVDGAGLSAGAYWLNVEQGGQAASTRLVLMK